MGGFSFGHGSSRRTRSGSFSSDSSSDSDRDFDCRSRGNSRRSRSGFNPRDPLANFSEEFRRTVEEIESGFGSDPMGSRTTERLPRGFSSIRGIFDRGRSSSSSNDRDALRTSAYSGFPGMPSDDRTTRSGFPGMPGDDRTQSSNFQGRGFRFTERSEPFNMRRTDSNFSSSGYGRGRSPSPSIPSSSHGRRFERTESPEGYSHSYGGSTFRSNSTARPTYRAQSPPRRRRSPSPIRRSNTTGAGRTDSARGFRTTERTPPGASSRAGASSSKPRSHSRAEPKSSSSSRNHYNGQSQYNGDTKYNGQDHYNGHGQYNGQSGFNGRSDYNGGYNNGTRSQSSSPKDPYSHYNGGPHTRTKHPGAETYEKSSSKPRSGSHARTGGSTFKPFAATAKPARSRAELKKIFDAYNTKWEALSRTDKAYPLPASTRELYKLDFAGGSAAKTGNWTNEEILIANVQLIFLAGFGMSGSLTKASDHLGVRIEAKALNGENLKLLAKWLSRKEQPRWHPDRMNLRTGVEGKLDEGISKKADVVAMRTAAQNLLEIVGK